MNRSELPRRTTPLADKTRREAWEELLLRRLLQAHSRAEPSPDECWYRISRRIAAHEQRRAINQAMAPRGSELRRMLVLSRPWPSLLSLFS